MSEQLPNLSQAEEAFEQIIELSRISLLFAGIERATQYPPGRPENDSEHSFNLGLVATELAATYHPDLDSGLVTQFALVHDLPEVYAGDVPSFNLTVDDRIKKELAEDVAAKQLIKELPPHTSQILARYEEQVELEARFVRFVDKLMPAITVTIADEENRDNFFEKFGVTTIEDVKQINERKLEELSSSFPEFTLLIELRRLVSASALKTFFPDIQT